MKTLILIRHAAAQSASSAEADKTRPLSASGAFQARQLPKILGSHNLSPTHILSSPATRAINTAQAITFGLGLPEHALETCHEIYFEGTKGLFSALMKIPPQTSCACLVGHNPHLSDFVRALTGTRVSDLATGGIAVINFDTATWIINQAEPQSRTDRFEILPEITIGK